MNIVELYTKMAFCYGCGQQMEAHKVYIRLIRDSGGKATPTYIAGHKRCI